MQNNNSPYPRGSSFSPKSSLVIDQVAEPRGDSIIAKSQGCLQEIRMLRVAGSVMQPGGALRSIKGADHTASSPTEGTVSQNIQEGGGGRRSGHPAAHCPY